MQENSNLTPNNNQST